MQQNNIQVGGPGGVQVTSIVPNQQPGMGMAPQQGMVQQQGMVPHQGMQPSARSDVSLDDAVSFVGQNRKLAGAALAAGGVGVAVLPAVFLSAVGISVGALIALPVVMGLSMVAGGVFLAKQPAASPLSPAVEQGLLTVAAQNGGRLTVPLAAQSLRVPLDQAQKALDELARRDYVTLENDDSGALIYKFRDMLPPQENP